jgi:hypothetical protein
LECKHGVDTPAGLLKFTQGQKKDNGNHGLRG